MKIIGFTLILIVFSFTLFWFGCSDINDPISPEHNKTDFVGLLPAAPGAQATIPDTSVVSITGTHNSNGHLVFSLTAIHNNVFYTATITSWWKITTLEFSDDRPGVSSDVQLYEGDIENQPINTYHIHFKPYPYSLYWNISIRYKVDMQEPRILNQTLPANLLATEITPPDDYVPDTPIDTPIVDNTPDTPVHQPNNNPIQPIQPNNPVRPPNNNPVVSTPVVNQPVTTTSKTSYKPIHSHIRYEIHNDETSGIVWGTKDAHVDGEVEVDDTNNQGSTTNLHWHYHDFLDNASHIEYWIRQVISSNPNYTDHQVRAALDRLLEEYPEDSHRRIYHKHLDINLINRVDDDEE